MNWKRYVILILLLFIAVLFRILLSKPTFLATSNWRKMIKVDSKKAYHLFKKAVEKDSIAQQHRASHEFGALLFKSKGIDSIDTCDSSFHYGCHHGFFGQAVSSHGISVVYKLDDACAKIPLAAACQHGIGHAIMDYYNGDEYINKALGACEKLKKYGSFVGCTNGVFMEYHMFTLRDSRSPRTLTENNIYIPCDQIPERFRKGCYYFQPQWWNHVFREDFKKIGSLCLSLNNKDYQQSCYVGTGLIAGSTEGFDLDKSIKICSEMPTREGLIFCKKGLAEIFRSEVRYKNLVTKICDNMTDEEKEICM